MEMVERVACAMAMYFSHNKQPVMSGNPMDRLSPHRRRECLDAARAAIRVMQEESAAPVPRSLDEWHEDMGPQLWWTFPIEEEPYVGSPLDCGWPEGLTHFTPIPIPSAPGPETDSDK